MELKDLSSDDFDKFLSSRVWAIIKDQIESAIEEGRETLEKASEITEIKYVQGGLEQLRVMLILPDELYIELKELRSKENAPSGRSEQAQSGE